MTTQEKIEQGHILSRVIVELMGKPKEHVEQTLKEYLDNLAENDEIKILKQDISPSKEVEEDNQGLWVTFTELEILTKDIPTLIGFCFDYMPSSIEILEPKEIKLKGSALSNIMNDLQAKLHKLDMAVKNLHNENQSLKRNTYFLTTNFTALLLKSGAKKTKDIANHTGISEKDVQGFLDKLVKDGKVKKEEDAYTWIQDVKRKE